MWLTYLTPWPVGNATERFPFRALERGVGIITGDDSHSPDDVGRNLDRAAEIAKGVGYDRVQLPARLGGTSWSR